MLDEPSVNAVVVNYRDITERKQAEEASRESEHKAAALLNALPDLMFRLDREGTFLDYKAEPSDLYAQSDQTLIGKKNRDIAPPEFADLIERYTRQTLNSGQMQIFEYQLPIPERGLRYYEARMVTSGKKVTASFGYHRAQAGRDGT
jgi:PAS domain S-box-containing protein